MVILDMDKKMPGMFIRVPHYWPAYRCGAVLLTTLAKPPRAPTDVAWKRRILSVCRCYWGEIFAQAPGSEALHGTYVPEELMVPQTQALRELKKVLDGLNRGLAGADVLAVFFRYAEARVARPMRGPQRKPDLKTEIEKVLRREAVYRMSLSPSQKKTMRSRMPEVSSARAVTNFAQRNLRPFRPVWHLLLALSYEIDKRALIAVRAAKRKARDGRPLMALPPLLWWQIVRSPDLLAAVFETAERLEALVPHLEIAHSSPEKVIRLRFH